MELQGYQWQTNAYVVKYRGIDFATQCARFCETKNGEKHDLLFLFWTNWQGSIYSQDKIRSVQSQSCRHKSYLPLIYQLIFTEVIFK